MQTILAAYAEATDDRGSSHDNCAAASPEEPQVQEQPEGPPPAAETGPRRRRWRWPGNIFLDGPSSGENARRWQTACGQGG